MAVNVLGSSTDEITQQYLVGSYTVANPFTADYGAIAVVTLIGGGGGGASGSSVFVNQTANPSNQGAGGGGGGGARLRLVFPASMVAGASLIVGAGGTAAAAVSRTASGGITLGASGNAGATTQLYLPGTAGYGASAGGGSPGLLIQNGSNTNFNQQPAGGTTFWAGASSIVLSNQPGGLGGYGGYVNSNATTLNAPLYGSNPASSSGFGQLVNPSLGSGGGGGGGVAHPTGTGIYADGAQGGFMAWGQTTAGSSNFAVSTAATTINGIAGGTATGFASPYGGAGGSGGGPAVRGASYPISSGTDLVIAGNGSAGQFPGGGGGGGGLAANGSTPTGGSSTVTSGAGGKGADGVCLITWYRKAPSNFA